MSEQKQDYVCTTEICDHKEWVWFQEYLEFNSAYKAGKLPEPKWDFQGGPLPLEYGLAYAQWVLDTPGVRDVIYRRFVLGQYENAAEGNLLSFATIFFLRKNDIDTNANSVLSICHRPIAKILQGQIASPKTKKYTQELLRSSWAFVDKTHQ